MYIIYFRKLVSILLVTYLPTVLMNMINQATNYITTEDKYSLILQINMYVRGKIFVFTLISVEPA